MGHYCIHLKRTYVDKLRIEGSIIFHLLEFNRQNSEQTCQKTHRAQILKNRGKRQRDDKNNPTGSSSRRKLPIEGSPATLKVFECGLMSELQTWLNTNTISTIQQLEEASRGSNLGDGNVQLILNAIAERKLQLAKVAHQGEEKLQRRNELNDREGWPRKWYEFRKQECG